MRDESLITAITPDSVSYCADINGLLLSSSRLPIAQMYWDFGSRNGAKNRRQTENWGSVIDVAEHDRHLRRSPELYEKKSEGFQIH
jgi:hypothetical protein